MNVILTTCKGRSEHLRPALQSWLDFMPGWSPVVVAVDDPRAQAITREICARREYALVCMSQNGFSRLGALSAGVDDLPPDTESVAILDADCVMLLHSRHWFIGDWSDAFRIVEPEANGSFCRDDFGDLLTHANVLRTAYDLLGDISDWVGYGWEDVLLRCACWVVTEGHVKRAPARWAHIPHTDELRRDASPGHESLRNQASVNYSRLMAALHGLEQYLGRPWRETSILDDCRSWA